VPASPWITVSSPPDPAGACTIFAARLPLRFYRQLPRLQWLTLRIRRRLNDTPGLLGYAFDLEIRHKTLWAGSAWAHRTGLADFDHSEVHLTAKRTLSGASLAPTFVVWTCPVDHLPVPWQEIRARLAAISS
jgi:hypothetical protein